MKLAALIVRAYLNHLLWFTIGVVAGSVQTLFVIMGLFAAGMIKP